MATVFEFKEVITADSSGKRLDLILAIGQSQISRSAARKILDNGQVLVNGKVEYRPNYKTREGDIIEIKPMAIETKNLVLTPEAIPLDIIYEDKDLLVVNKPAGMVIHPATGNESHTLMNAVTYYLKDPQGIGETFRSGLIHRIDKDTSGLVLIGKTNESLWYYSRLFAERKVAKTYIAVSAGNFKAKIKDSAYRVVNYLGRNPGSRKKYSVVGPSKGKIAESHFVLINLGQYQGRDYSVVEAHPKTGRTHQIRVHLSSMGLPIMGDVIYGGKNNYSRLLLHAWKIKLILLGGKEVELEAPIPEEFKDFLN